MSKIEVDFFLSSDPYHIKAMDLSVWGVIETATSIVEITLPGYTECLTLYWDKYKTNIFNSFTLGLACATCDTTNSDKVTLPDGIYKYVVKGSPDKFFKERYYMKTDMLKMDLAKMYVEYPDAHKNIDFRNKVTEIEYLLKSAAANLEYDNITTAGELFQTAVNAVEDLAGCKTCM